MARRYCLDNDYPFTTSFHTRFPEYIHARWRVPVSLSYGALRRFHNRASAVMVATQTIKDGLKAPSGSSATSTSFVRSSPNIPTPANGPRYNSRNRRPRGKRKA